MLNLLRWHSIWALAYILAVLIPIQVLIYGLGQQQRMVKSSGPCAHIGAVEENRLVANLGLAQLWHCGPLRSEPTGGKVTSLGGCVSCL